MGTTAPSGLQRRAARPPLACGTIVRLFARVEVVMADRSTVLSLVRPDGDPCQATSHGYPQTLLTAPADAVQVERRDGFGRYADPHQLPLFGRGRLLDARGFSLIELLIVIVIFVTLVSIAAVLAGGAIADARKLKCASNVRSIGQLTADAIGAIRKHRRFPTWEEMDVKDSPVLYCPSDKRDGYLPSSYIRQVSGVAVGPLHPMAIVDIEPWYRIPVVFDAEPWHRVKRFPVRNVGMLDGSVEEWQ